MITREVVKLREDDGNLWQGVSVAVLIIAAFIAGYWIRDIGIVINIQQAQPIRQIYPEQEYKTR